MPAAGRTPRLDKAAMLPRRLRKLIGTVLILAFVGVYATAAMLVAQAEVIHRAPGWAQGLFFAVVGLVWILPLMPLIVWMERPDADDPTSHG